MLPKKLPNVKICRHEHLLVHLVAESLLLPDPKVVDFLGGAVFPTIRDHKRQISRGVAGDVQVMFDDNTTPRWAILWSHGIAHTNHPKGWTFAHVWPSSKDPSSYTHVANLVIMPKYFASLSDKEGPLEPYLQYHAWKTYSWKPESAAVPVESYEYSRVTWHYLNGIDDPRKFIHSRIVDLSNQRCLILRELMELERQSSVRRIHA